MTWTALERWIINPSPNTQDEKKRLQSLFLSVCLLLSVALLGLLSIIYLIGTLSALNWNLPIDLPVMGLVCAFFCVLLFLNRRGFIRESAYGYITVCMISISLLIPSEWMPYSLLLYGIPIQVSSFLIHPRASIFLAVLSTGFSLMIKSNMLSVPPGMLVIFISAMFLSAVTSWFVSDRLDRALGEAHQSENKYLTMLEKNPFCVYVTQGSQAGHWIYLSQRIRDLLGFSASEWLGTPGLWIRQVHPDDRQRVLTETAQSLTNGQPFHAEYRMIHHSGRVVWVSDDAVPARVPGQPDQVQGVLLDITARKRAEQVQQATYRISQAAFSADDLGDLYRQIHEVLGELMHAENFFIALYDPETDMLNFPYFVDQYDDPPEPIIARHGLTEYILRTGKALFATQEKCAELVAQGEISDVGAPSVDWLGVPLIINNHPIGVMTVQSYTEGIRFSDEELDILKFVSTQVAMVIDRKRTEAALREVNQLTSEVISGVNTGIIVYDLDARHLIWNRYMEQMTGLSKDTVLGQSAPEIFPLFHQSDLLAFLQRAMTGETLTIPDIEYSVPLTGKGGWLSGFFGPHRNAQGEMIGAIAVINEITERKIAEETLRAALSEKEVLLREIHHRVKNNLQVISSLISLQADTVQNEEVRDSFNEMQARVRSMALIHEELYQAQDLARVNFAEYINKLAAGLTQTYMFSPNISIQVDVEEILLGVDTAIPCGLIVNELVTNALKYAFPDGRKGVVNIELRTNSHNNYCLIVKDNGVGLPPEIDIENTSTLGMQLITILIRQLRGTLLVKSEEGAYFQIEFSENRPPARRIN